MKKNNHAKIMMVAGGTGGHLFPAIALSEQLSLDKKYEIILVTDLRCNKYLPSNLPIKHHIVKIYINFKGIKNIICSFWQMITSILHSIQIVYSEKPKLVIGFGGYTSFPTLIVAKIINIPIIVFEPNSFMGRVNLFFAKYAKKIITSTEITNIPIQYKNKLIYSPLLIRQKIKEYKKTYQANSNIFHLLIIGGSQGASFFDDVIPEAIEQLLTIDPKINIKITQQVKKENIEKLEAKYRSMNIEHHISDFFIDIPDIYNSVQLIISRSGASSVSEITYMNIPAIYIPYPYSKDDHQFYNAKVIQEQHYGWCFRQAEITSNKLALLLKELICNPMQLQKISDNMAKNCQKTNMQHLSSTLLEIIDQ
ncbi:MAG: undecaprenyldiphospho-muramoylpentapeptide beta-N-acetylglucosaminyltransferase [Rickettsiaceae bacterium]|nr:undecaprenyldiphospho-muramoylpentapeptide beta-N-acetylglucosaminyltransferase [Rickettsiaceae bacterium]